VENYIDNGDRVCTYFLRWTRMVSETPGGLDRYVYELTRHLAAGNDQVELYALGLLRLNQILRKTY